MMAIGSYHKGPEDFGAHKGSAFLHYYDTKGKKLGEPFK